MLHELLLALLGRTGQMIIEIDGSFKIDPKIDLISDPEKEIINKICTLGYYYMKIQNFMSQTDQIFSNIALQLTRNMQDNEGRIESENFIGNSAYIKAFCCGVEEIINTYQEKILGIERTYLSERVFTLSALSVKLSDYFYIMPEINYIIEKIVSDKCKGGQIVDLLQAGLLTGNSVIRDLYKRILKYTYKVLFNQVKGVWPNNNDQIIAWIVNGALIDFHEEFFIYKLDSNKFGMDLKSKTVSPLIIQGLQIQFGQANLIEEEKEVKDFKKKSEPGWDSGFTLRPAMIPQSIISVRLAENILFIGKAQRVLHLKNGSNGNFSLDSLKILTQLSSSEILDTLLFQNTIEKIRFEIAQKLMDLILVEEKLMEHLRALRSFYFMDKGEFYQIFIEEARNMMKLPPRANSENEINAIALQNSIIRLDLDDSRDIKNIRFKITNNGFEYLKFNHTENLNIAGNVLRKGDVMQFDIMKSSKESGCIWHNIKQSLENGFEMSFSMRFKRPAISHMPIKFEPFSSSVSRIGSVNDTEFDPRSIRFDNNTSLCLVIQNSKEISNIKKNGVTHLKDLNEYIAVKIMLQEKVLGNNQSNKNFISSVGFYYFAKDKNFTSNSSFEKKYERILDNLSEEKKLAEIIFDNNDINFAEEDIHQFKLKYDGEYLYFDSGVRSKDSANYMKPEEHTLKIPVKLGLALTLDTGRAHVGFVQESNKGVFMIDLINWKMMGINIYNKEDSWNGLTVSYNVKWPLDLLLSNQVMERYTNIFRFLFPIRCIQFELHQLWLNLIKKNRRHTYDKAYNKILHLRNQMSFFIDNLWSYFHVDGFSVQWARLEENLANVKDFDELRKIHEQYLNSISNHIFLNYSKMVTYIFSVVQQCKRLVTLVYKSELDISINEMMKTYEKIKEDYEQSTNDMLGFISIVNQKSNLANLYQLILRLDYNNYYNDITLQSMK